MTGEQEVLRVTREKEVRHVTLEIISSSDWTKKVFLCNSGTGTSSLLRKNFLDLQSRTYHRQDWHQHWSAHGNRANHRWHCQTEDQHGNQNVRRRCSKANIETVDGCPTRTLNRWGQEPTSQHQHDHHRGSAVTDKEHQAPDVPAHRPHE